jgi:UDPglucose--hexose-1-phosphate uridylyltransferase
MSDVRVDPLTGAVVHVVGNRQSRPNQPDDGCPFCPGGLEAPGPYGVRWFPNRWPSMPGSRCEVLLYAPEHDVSLATLAPARVRLVVDLWAERSAELGARADVGYVLVFENRGAEVGATIDHPHGQLYAFRDVPPVPAEEIVRVAAHSSDPLAGPPRPNLEITAAPGWRAWVPAGPVHPVDLVLAPIEAVPDLPDLDAAGRDGLAALLVDVLARLDRLYGQPIPYLLYVHQRPFTSEPWPLRLHVHVHSPWRAAGVARYIAAGELGSGEFFNPVVPEALAADLRAAVARPARKGA